MRLLFFSACRTSQVFTAWLLSLSSAWGTGFQRIFLPSASAAAAAAKPRAATRATAVRIGMLGRFIETSSVGAGFAPAAGVIDVDGLQLGEEFHGHLAHLAQSHAGGFHPSEGQMRLAADRGRIDVRDAGFDPVDEGEDARRVVRIERARKAVADRIG